MARYRAPLLRTTATLAVLACLPPAPSQARSSKSSAPAVAPAVIAYSPPADMAEERPAATRAEVSSATGDIAIHLTFNKAPWGEACKTRCASVTLFLDTDNSTTTGLQMGRDHAETGADLAVTIQGAREYKEKSADVFLRARVRKLDDAAHTLEQGTLAAELDHRKDRDRLQTDGNDVHVLVDTANLELPQAKLMRVVYHPPADKALEANTRGTLGLGGHGSLQIMEGFSTKNRRRKR